MSDPVAERVTPHTPGRWLDSNRTFRTHNHRTRYWERHVHTAAELDLVATGSGATREEAEANARLIAASPSMLMALKSCDDAFANWQMGQIPGRPEDILALIVEVRRAIALAEGRDAEGC